MPSTIANCSAEVFSNVTAAVTSIPYYSSTSVEHMVEIVPAGVKL